MKKKKPERYMYWIEEEKNLFYVYYWKPSHGIVKTLFDVKHTREEAEQAIAEHKEGKHPTQYKPE